MQLSLDEGRAAARSAVLAGNFQLARDFALALTEANPDDRTALVVLAAAQPQLGQAREGRAAGLRAFRLSTTESERYEAARLVALAAANEERYTLSQYWLRRAAANAPDPAAYAQTARDFRGISNLNPWSVRFAFNIAPSNNVNGGSVGDCNQYYTVIVDGIPQQFCFGTLSEDAQALSGVTATGDLRLRYRLSAGEDFITQMTLRAYARNVWLSDDASESAPDSRNSDFASQVLEFGLSREMRMGDGSLAAQVLFGTSWFGGDPSQRYVRGTLGYALPVGEATRLNLGGFVEKSYRYVGEWEPRSERISLNAGLTHILPSRDRVTGQIIFERQFSDGVNERYTSATAQLSYTYAEPLGPVRLSVQGGLSYTSFQDYQLLFPTPRDDTRLFATVQATLHEIEYAGFVPVVRLTAEQTDSNVGRFTREAVTLDLGFRSSF
ncbi:MAG: hypothetical protein AAGL89_05140 [Pseudomonadota bacterium]